MNGQMMEILTFDEFAKNADLVSPGSTCIERTTESGETILLPYKGKLKGDHKYPEAPGVYNLGPCAYTVYPDSDKVDNYKPDKIIELNNKDGIKAILEAETQLTRLADPWITSPDNVTTIQIEEDDRPEVVGLKTAINEKKIDLDKYSARFGENYPNDKRQLKNSGITLKILERFCNNLDIEAVITFRDKNPNVPNPIGRDISISLTDGFVDSDDE
jgi:hypothetical protein